YPDGKVVYAPGTVIISAVAEVADIRKAISPALLPVTGSSILYIDFSSAPASLGGSSFAQVVNQLGNDTPDVTDVSYFCKAFDAVQELIAGEVILAGHDISAGGIITSLLEMCFPTPGIGLEMTLPESEDDTVRFIFSERPGVVIQVQDIARVRDLLLSKGLRFHEIGKVTEERLLKLETHRFDIDGLRATWFSTSHKLDRLQRPVAHADKRFANFSSQPLEYTFPSSFDGTFSTFGIDPDRRDKAGIRAAIIREKGVNADRELAYCLYLAGFDVKDVHMTDLVSGREDLSDVNLIAFPGGFANSDVLGSAKGWAGAFLYNERARTALNAFYERPDTLSIGVCNGCQLMMELGLLYPEWPEHPKMHHN